MALLMGTVLGFLTGLGVGGGSLLILWLTLGLGMDQETATGINLLFFLPSALVSGCFRYRQGAVDLKKLAAPMAAGALAAAVFTTVGTAMDPEPLKKLFGLLLLATGIREVFYKGSTQ